MRALGIDVGVAKGLDLVLMDDRRRVVQARRRVMLHEIGPLLAEVRPHVVAIDSPPSWARRGRSRQTERELRWLGIQSFGTPTGPRGRDNDFYRWMRVGFETFRIAARRGYPRYRGGAARGQALEVFPHATAVILAGCLPPAREPKRRWRARVLSADGVPVEGLSSLDLIDAALAALTGLYALDGRCTALGDTTEGVIVLPARQLPASRYRPCAGPPRPDGHPRLPGLSPCACGDPDCRALTAREFAPGHDAKRKALLWTAARAGHDALDELRRRGWELPPEMR